MSGFGPKATKVRRPDRRRLPDQQGERRAARDSVACGPDPGRHLEAIKPYVELGFDEVYVGNIGPHYADMLQLFGEEILPEARKLVS